MKNGGALFIPSGLTIAEKAVDLLRRAGAPALIDYYIGSLPFVLGLLYFWSDMSRNPIAGRYCGPSAAGLALLFVWMKYWQVRFCRRLTCLVQGVEPESWPLKRSLATLARQSALQATGVLVLPLSAVIVLPWAWTYAFYQNAAIMDDPRPKGVIQLGRNATRQALLWPGQNHLFLSVLTLFGFIVLVNLGITLILLPNLIKSLLGIETVFTLSAWSMLNTTFLAVQFSLAYLCIDPIIKAGYVLRCFHGAALQTGEDIRAALKPYLALTLICVALSPLLLPARSSAQARDDARPGIFFPHAAMDISDYPRRMDAALDQVLLERRFTWRLPREKTKTDQAAREQGWLGSVFDWLGDLLASALQPVGHWIKAFMQWLKQFISPPAPVEAGGGGDWRGPHRAAFYALGVALAVILVLGAIRWRRGRRPTQQAPHEMTTAQIVDLSDENLSAQDLPTDRWLQLAAEMMKRQDYRHALRALYLSVISILAEGNRVVPARHKTNQDYYYELARHAHAEPEILQLFLSCMRLFEQAWYGMHAVSNAQVERFAHDQKRIYALVQPAL